MGGFRIAVAQINPVVGDIEYNASKILDALERARKWDADLVVLPELAMTGYPPEDLLLKARFIEENEQRVQAIASVEHNAIIILGFVHKQDDVFNAACVIHNGRICGVYHKTYLPNYGVFDEERYFSAGSRPAVVKAGEVTIGLSICEDIWYPEGPVAEEAISGGAQIIVNLSASPYHMGKSRQRERMLCTRAHDHAAIVVFANMVGGQDELVFDGNSMIIDERGEIVARGKSFEEDLVIADVFPSRVFSRRLHDPRRRKLRKEIEEANGALDVITLDTGPAHNHGTKPGLPRCENTTRASTDATKMADSLTREAYHALSLGLRDYVKKNNFQRVVVGLSGGIDSALTATIAADALGKENVVGVSMPSRFTEDISVRDAKALSDNLGIEFRIIPIEPMFKVYLEALEGMFQGLPFGVAEENLQARIRGNLLMALSNKFGWLVVTTGNKSEMSVGYATLYGDMAGGFALLKDVPKTLVYKLADYRNAAGPNPVIPESIIRRPPTAELRPDQKDTDSLPPYELLDPIIQAYVEEDTDVSSLVAMGYPLDVVRRVVNLVTHSEYKRRQAPPGVKITPRAFGRDRRFPLTNHFLD